jgi:hypothetical protein
MIHTRSLSLALLALAFLGAGAIGATREPPSSATPADLRARITPLLRAMESAVRAGDAPAYLALVDHRDPEFAREQKNWFADLKPHPVAQYDLSIEDDLESIAPDECTARLTTVWRMGEGPARHVTFLARFVRGESAWLYAGERWTETPGERVLVLRQSARAEETAKDVAKVLPGVRAHVHEEFEFPPEEPLLTRTQKVKLYTSMAQLQHSIYLSYTDALSGWNEPGEAIKILVRDGGRPERSEALLAHEYGHVASFALGEKINDAPWWALEGIAELMAQHYERSKARVERTVRAWAKTESLVDWDKLADFKGEALQHQDAVYTQGHAMLIYISDRFGRSPRNAWLRALAQGKTLDDATRDALKMPFPQLDHEWRASLLEPLK